MSGVKVIKGSVSALTTGTTEARTAGNLLGLTRGAVAGDMVGAVAAVLEADPGKLTRTVDEGLQEKRACASMNACSFQEEPYAD